MKLSTRQRRAFMFWACICLFIAMSSCTKKIHAESGEDLQIQALSILGRMDRMIDIISPSSGLTEEGCRLFFINELKSSCLTKWQSLSVAEKVVHLKNHGSPISRGAREAFRTDRLLPEVVAQVADMIPGLPRAEIRKLLYDSSVQNILRCSKTIGHVDSCLFAIGNIATAAEVGRAQQYMLDLLRKEQDRPQQQKRGRIDPIALTPAWSKCSMRVFSYITHPCTIVFILVTIYTTV